MKQRIYLTKEQQKEVCQLYLQSVFNSCKILAKRFGCNWATILNILKRNNVKVRTNSESQKGLRLGERHPNWKGGNISPDGYKRICIKGIYHQEHRYIMEQCLKRKLLSSEIVHHLNENKLDNWIGNLKILTRSEHCKLHKPNS